jgi:hypothetical protein
MASGSISNLPYKQQNRLKEPANPAKWHSFVAEKGIEDQIQLILNYADGTIEEIQKMDADQIGKLNELAGIMGKGLTDNKFNEQDVPLEVRSACFKLMAVLKQKGGSRRSRKQRSRKQRSRKQRRSNNSRNNSRSRR